MSEGQIHMKSIIRSPEMEDEIKRTILSRRQPNEMGWTLGTIVEWCEAAMRELPNLAARESVTLFREAMLGERRTKQGAPDPSLFQRK
jgi:hypothetical protein